MTPIAEPVVPNIDIVSPIVEQPKENVVAEPATDIAPVVEPAITIVDAAPVVPSIDIVSSIEPVSVASVAEPIIPETLNPVEPALTPVIEPVVTLEPVTDVAPVLEPAITIVDAAPVTPSIDIISPIEPVSVASVAEPIIPETLNPVEPVVTSVVEPVITPEPVVNPTNNSTVTDAYTREMNEIIAAAKQKTEEFQEKFNNLVTNYMNEMTIYEQKAEELNKQAQTRNELASKTLANYQNMAMNQPMNSFVEETPVLTRTSI